MRVGLIGAGRIGTHHAGSLAGLSEIDSLLVTDAAPERARNTAANLPRTEAVPLDEIFTSVDAVVIASSTDTHAELLHAAVSAGVPAFCEKPIALDLDSTRSVVAAIAASGVTVQMGFQRRYDPAMREIRDRLTAGSLGTPYLVRSQTHDPSPPPLDYIPHSGGIFKDCLIHDIDIVRYVTGQEVRTVRASGAVVVNEDIGRLGDYDTAVAGLELSEGTLAQLSGLRHDPVGYDVRLEVFGSRDSVAAGWSTRTPIHSTEPGVAGVIDPIVSFWDRFDAAYRTELEAFLRVVNGEEEPASTAADAYEDLRVAVACDISAAQGRTVELDEVS
ncbi:MAG: Gfo/Idh/MocA family oxidoreductase [Acidimicrobiia bacterium]